MLLQSSRKDLMRPEFQQWQKPTAGSKTKKNGLFRFYNPWF